MKANNTLSPAPQAPAQAQDIVAFWQAAGPRRWFRKDSTFDEALRERFLAVHEAAARGECDAWARHASGSLALLILLDQFPRNAFRQTPRMFATDAQARAVADAAITVGHDRAVPPALRQFFYLPFMHSEALADQEKSLTLYAALAADNAPDARSAKAVEEAGAGGAAREADRAGGSKDTQEARGAAGAIEPLDATRHAREHHDIVARFGRFPHRNAVLGRASTAAELTFLDDGGFAG